ncbi:MAG: hypothetical protein FJ395_19830 [Verrucomicrobia bacterium]|nr:hypothetical protein [Verrucomicrobiota bacterium]
MNTRLCLLLLAITVTSAIAAENNKQPWPRSPLVFKAPFLALCDEACPVVREQATRLERTSRRAFYWDSYAVRGLCAAYDMTGKKEYLDASVAWANGMVEFQKGMIPKGAYYIQYYRKPGESEGAWYVADSSSIALGVLAVAVRCREPQQKEKFLNSVRAYAKLVADNWVRPTGGVCNGHWPKSDKEWWCSSGIFGSLAFHLYEETGDESHLKIGLGTLDWLSRQDLFLTDYPLPTVFMYSLEAYSAGLPHVKPGTPLHQAVMAQLAKLNIWMSVNLGGRAGMNYITQWGSKFGGLPFHLFIQARLTGNQELQALGDKELACIAKELTAAPASDNRDQLGLFVMMSYAERICPGSIDRTSKQDPKNPLGRKTD